MTSASELQERLNAAQERLTRALAGVTEEQFKRRPPATPDDPSPWCFAEVLAHVLHIERLWVERIALALSEEGATIRPSPPEAHEAMARRGRQVPVPLLIHGLLGARHEALKLLDRAQTPDGGLRANALWHPRLEERLDLGWMFEKIAAHQEEHAGQIEELRQTVGAEPVRELTP